MVSYTLGSEVRKPINGCPGFYMRIDEDLRKTVVFLGVRDDTPGKGGIHCCGTGFLLGFDDGSYLVTARHVADGIGDNPFVVRMNKKDGTAENFDADNVQWYVHPDPTVDIAVIPFQILPYSPFDALYLPEKIVVSDNAVQNDKVKAFGTMGTIGIGDITYTIGLFQFLSGEKRNLPVVHTGSIAMVPRDEKIPVTHWKNKNEIMNVEGYLVETQAMRGLSGSPVFVRRTLYMSSLPSNILIDPRVGNNTDFIDGAYVSAPQKIVHLLGIWQSSWEAPPAAIMAVERGENVRVPLGMGIVVPAQKIIETLMHEDLISMRKKVKEERKAMVATQAATPDSAFPVARVNADNPSHKEDFMRLANEAAKKQPQDD